jgi:hypothetical protein
MLNLMKQIIVVYNWLHNPHETSFLVGITFFFNGNMIRKWRLKYLEGKAEGFESFKKTLDPSESLEPVRVGT